MKSLTQRGLVLLSVAVALPAFGQVTIPEEYGKHITTAETVGALGTDLFGDNTNFYTGSTEFIVADVSLAGNNTLPVAVGRKFSVEGREESAAFNKDMFGDWDLEIPHLHGIFPLYRPWQVSGSDDDLARRVQRCSVDNAIQARPPVTKGFGMPAGLFYPEEYWQGNYLYVPGVGDQEMLVIGGAGNRPTDGKTYYWATKDQWFFSCLPATANGIPGEAFLVLAPDGTRYWFDWFAERPAPDLAKPFGTGVSPLAMPAPEDQIVASTTSTATPTASNGSMTSLGRIETWILPTRVQDRFGNSVTYSYDPEHPARLLSIVASDGRQLTLSYNSDGRIESVFDGTRTWRYEYTPAGPYVVGQPILGRTLSTVVLPDQSKWQIAFSTLDQPWIKPYGHGQTEYSPRCDHPAMEASPASTGTITHPSGAVGRFTFQAREHGRSYVPKECVRMSSDYTDLSTYARHPYRFAAVALLSKEISGPGLSPHTWSYTYGPLNNSWAGDCTSGGCPSTKVVEAAGPSEYIRYTFGNRHRDNEGKLLKTEHGASANVILRTETSTYVLDATGQAFPATMGISPNQRGDGSGERQTPLQQRQVFQQGSVFTWQVANDCSGALCFDSFARPKKVRKSSAPAP